MKEAYTEPWPGDLHKLIRKKYFDPNYFAGNTLPEMLMEISFRNCTPTAGK